MFVKNVPNNYFAVKIKENVGSNSISFESHIIDIIKDKLNSGFRRMVSRQYILSKIDNSFSPDPEKLNKALRLLERKGVIAVKDREPGNKICEVTLR